MSRHLLAAAMLSLASCAHRSVVLDAPAHYKSGTSAQVNDLTFTLRMLPKLMVSGPEPEIEQVQIEATRGADHTVLQVDTRAKSAEWAGYVFVLGYADVHQDDIELTVHKK